VRRCRRDWRTGTSVDLGEVHQICARQVGGQRLPRIERDPGLHHALFGPDERVVDAPGEVDVDAVGHRLGEPGERVDIGHVDVETLLIDEEVVLAFAPVLETERVVLGSHGAVSCTRVEGRARFAGLCLRRVGGGPQTESVPFCGGRSRPFQAHDGPARGWSAAWPGLGSETIWLYGSSTAWAARCRI
jgi:hypothetical protein